MREFTETEIAQCNEMTMSWLALAPCWFSIEDCRSLAYALSEPNRYVLKAAEREASGQNYAALKGAMGDVLALPLDKRRWAVGRVYDQNPYNARRYILLMKDCLRGLVLTGRRGYTLKQVEVTLKAIFENDYEALKGQGDTILRDVGIENAGEQFVEFFWESIVGEKELPFNNPNIKDALDWQSNNRAVVLDRLLALVSNPESTEFKRVFSSMMHSYLREYRGASKDVLVEVGSDDLGRSRRRLKREILLSDYAGLDVPETSSEDAEFEELEQRQAMEDLLSLISVKKDRKVVELALEYDEKGYSTQEIEADLNSQYDELGIGPWGYRKRLERMRDKYPELNKRLQPFKKKQ